MKRYLKRAIILLLVLVTNMSLMGCTSLEELHCTKEQAQVIAEELTGQKVTYVTTNEIAEDKKKIYIFADGQGREFAIVSELTQKNFDGASYGAYRCTISDNYITSMFVAHYDEIMDILASYQLSDYVADNLIFGKDREYIYNGKGVNASCLYMDITAGGADENLEMLEKIASAGAEIDKVMALNYDLNYKEKADSKNIDYVSYNDYYGICIDYNWKKPGEYGTYWNATDKASFQYSTSDDARWSKEELLRYLYEQYTDIELSGLE